MLFFELLHFVEKMVPNLLIFFLHIYMCRKHSSSRVENIPAKVGIFLHVQEIFLQRQIFSYTCRKYSCKGRYFPTRVGNIPAKVDIFLHVQEIFLKRQVFSYMCRKYSYKGRIFPRYIRNIFAKVGIFCMCRKYSCKGRYFLTCVGKYSELLEYLLHVQEMFLNCSNTCYMCRKCF